MATLCIPPGNYPQDLLSQLQSGTKAPHEYGCSGETPITVAFLDINNFTRSCEQASKEPGALEDFLSQYYTGVIPQLGLKANINKMMGDGILMTFPTEFDACEGCIGAVKWWRNQTKAGVIRRPFSDPTVSLVAMIGTLNVLPFRLGSLRQYLDYSWVGADLNRFFKDSKSDEFIKDTETCVWLNETAAVNLSSRVKLIKGRTGRYEPSSGVNRVSLPFGLNNSRSAKYYGLTLKFWHKACGLAPLS